MHPFIPSCCTVQPFSQVSTHGFGAEAQVTHQFEMEEPAGEQTFSHRHAMRWCGVNLAKRVDRVVIGWNWGNIFEVQMILQQRLKGWRHRKKRRNVSFQVILELLWLRNNTFKKYYDDFLIFWGNLRCKIKWILRRLLSVNASFWACQHHDLRVGSVSWSTWWIQMDAKW